MSFGSDPLAAILSIIHALAQVKAYIKGKREPTPPPDAPDAEETPEAEQHEAVKGKVVVIGAGPAGLAAALQLKVRRVSTLPEPWHLATVVVAGSLFVSGSSYCRVS